MQIDDAISIEFVENSTYIWVHLSYPVKLFKFNSEIDLEARNKSSSLYLIDNYRPMLPLNIIDEANLKRNKVSESLSARIELNENGHEFGRGESPRSRVQPGRRLYRLSNASESPPIPFWVVLSPF